MKNDSFWLLKLINLYFEKLQVYIRFLFQGQKVMIVRNWRWITMQLDGVNVQRKLVDTWWQWKVSTRGILWDWGYFLICRVSTANILIQQELRIPRVQRWVRAQQLRIMIRRVQYRLECLQAQVACLPSWEAPLSDGANIQDNILSNNMESLTDPGALN